MINILVIDNHGHHTAPRVVKNWNKVTTWLDSNAARGWSYNFQDIGWCLSINDDELATLFALTWM